MSIFVSQKSLKDQEASIVAFLKGHGLITETEESALASSPFLPTLAKTKAFSLAMLNKATILEITSLMRLLAVLTGAQGDSDDATEALIAMSKGIASAEFDPPAVLDILVSVYNTLPASSASARCRILALVALVGAKNNKAAFLAADLLVPADLHALLRVWQVPAQDARELWTRAAECLAVAGQGKSALLSRVAFLRSFDAQKPEAAQEATLQRAAADAAMQAIVLPDIFVCRDVLALDAVSRLANGKGTDALLHQILTVLVSGTLADFAKLEKMSAEGLRAAKIDTKALGDKMRLLTVASICADAIDRTMVKGSTATVGLGDLATALNEDEAKAEVWLVAAINAGLVKGRIDQLERTAIVSYAVRRQIVAKDWEMLQGALGRWASALERPGN